MGFKNHLLPLTCLLADGGRHVHHGLVKQKPRHQKTARQQAAIMSLTPAIVRNAREVVLIYDRIDWQRADQTQCDTVHIYFQSVESLPAAHLIWLEIAAGMPAQRTVIFGKIKQAFKKIGFPPPRGKMSDADPVQLSARNVTDILDELTANQNPNLFAKLCIQASLLHHRLDAEARQTTRNPARKAGGKTLQPPLAVAPPSWLGPVADLWISVPLRLALAEPIVGLCRRITEINTGENTLQLKTSEEQALQQHHRFFIECQPESYRVPIDDPFGAELQVVLDAFIPALRLFTNDWSNQVNATGLTTAATDLTESALPKTQRKADECTKPESGEKAVKLKDAAQMLGVCENTVRRLIDRNKLRRVHGLRHVLIPVSEIDRFLS